MAASNNQTIVIILLANFVMLSFFYLLVATSGSSSAAASANAAANAAAAAKLAPAPSPVSPQLLQQRAAQQAAAAAASAANPLVAPAAPALAPAPAIAVPAAPQIIVKEVVKEVAAPESRNALFGLAHKLELHHVYRFVRSFRQSAGYDPNTHVILFVSKEDVAGNAEWTTLAAAFRVQVEVYDVASFAAHIRAYHPSSYRWILTRDFLLKQQSKLPGGSGAAYDKLMFADVRDTIFQRNPFQIITKPGFYAFQEAVPTTIRQCGWNSGWVKDCFGQQILNEVGEFVVSCSGTSLATWQSALIYCNLMADTLSKNPLNCERNGVDQGMHNVWVYQKSNKLSVSGGGEGLHIFSNEMGPIATVQSMRVLRRDRYGRVLNDARAVAHVVHQYDRSNELKAQYDREYVLLSPEVLERK